MKTDNLQDSEKIKYSFSSSLPKDVSVTELGAKDVIDIECSGWLLKEGGDVKNWKTRWFVLGASHGLLYYYKTPEDKQPKGFIPLHGCQLKVNDKKRRLCFQISHPDRREFFLVANDNKDMFKWIQSVQKVIDKTNNEKLGYIKHWEQSLGHTILEWNELIKIINQQLELENLNDEEEKKKLSIEQENLFHYLIVTLCNDENQPLNLVTLTQLTTYISLFGPILNVLKFREIHKWYHGYLEESSVQKKLRQKESGTFIVWLNGYPGELTLSVNGEAIKHFAIKLEPVTNQFYFNKYNHGDKTYPSVEELVRSDNKKKFKKFVLSPFVMFYREFDYQREQYFAQLAEQEENFEEKQSQNNSHDNGQVQEQEENKQEQSQMNSETQNEQNKDQNETNQEFKEVKQEPNEEVKKELKEEVKEQPKEEVKEEVKGEQPKEEVKQEPNEDTKQETKEELKEEFKQQTVTDSDIQRNSFGSVRGSWTLNQTSKSSEDPSLQLGKQRNGSVYDKGTESEKKRSVTTFQTSQKQKYIIRWAWKDDFFQPPSLTTEQLSTSLPASKLSSNSPFSSIWKILHGDYPLVHHSKECEEEEEDPNDAIVTFPHLIRLFQKNNLSSIDLTQIIWRYSLPPSPSTQMSTPVSPLIQDQSSLLPPGFRPLAEGEPLYFSRNSEIELLLIRETIPQILQNSFEPDGEEEPNLVFEADDNKTTSSSASSHTDHPTLARIYQHRSLVNIPPARTSVDISYLISLKSKLN